MPLLQQQQLQPAGSVAEAISKGYFAQVRYLLEQRNSSANSRDAATGRTALILCSLIRDSRWSLSLARLLLEKGASVGLKDRRGLNALHYACAHARRQLVELFLEAIDYRVNERDRQRNTPLHYAAVSGCADIVRSLLQVLRRFDLPLQLPNQDGITPLMLAYRHGHLDVAELLVESGADCSAVDGFGKSTIVYEQEALTRQRLQQEEKEAKRNGRKLRFDDIDGWRRHKSRLRSAAPSRTASATPTFRQQQQDARRDEMYHPDDSDLISCASPLDRHNDPGEVFHVSAVDFFARRQQAESQLSISGVSLQRPNTAAATAGAGHSSRAQSAAPAVRDPFLASAASIDSCTRSEDSRHCAQAQQQQQQQQQRRQRAQSAKADIPKLFFNFEFHCSHLYRPPPKQPDPMLHVHDFNSRFLQPTAADADGSDNATPQGRRKKADAKKQKKSVAAAAAEAKKKPGRVSRAAFNREG